MYRFCLKRKCPDRAKDALLSRYVVSYTAIFPPTVVFNYLQLATVIVIIDNHYLYYFWYVRTCHVYPEVSPNPLTGFS